jgi:4,5-DOPA dioxygenase extradiol
LAERARELVGADRAALRGDWGLDHGTWSVLRWLYPKADVPVVQLSLDHRLAPAEHYALAQRLRPLRDEGVLIFASGNIVHNLAHAFRGGGHAGGTPDWASRFDQAVADALGRHDEPMLLGLWPGTADGRMSHPAPDHLLPLFYAAGAASEEDRVRFPITGFDLGSISMRSVLFESPQGGQRPC